VLGRTSNFVSVRSLRTDRHGNPHLHGAHIHGARVGIRATEDAVLTAKQVRFTEVERNMEVIPSSRPEERSITIGVGGESDRPSATDKRSGEAAYSKTAGWNRRLAENWPF
jgi:hypothetical protein